MKVLSGLSVLSVLMLGACSHYSEDLSSLDGEMSKPVTVASAMKAQPQDIAPAAGGVSGHQMSMTTPNTFPQLLAREYYAMAKFENDQAYDYKASKSFTQKALMASKGKTVEPSKISSFDLTPARAAELMQARNELVSALAMQNTPENAQSLAKAQARFECWIDRAEEAANDAHYASCREEFEGAMASLMMPAAGTPKTFDIAFDQESATISPQAQATLETIATFLQDPANAGYTANVMGVMAQSQQPAAINLTTTRMRALQDALVIKGIAPNRIQSGLSPAIITGDASSGIVRVMMVGPDAAAVQPTEPARPVPAPKSSSPLDGLFHEGTAPKTN